MPHHYEWDLKKTGDRGFKRMEDKDIRKLEIPTSDSVGLAKAHEKYLPAKKLKGKK